MGCWSKTFAFLIVAIFLASLVILVPTRVKAAAPRTITVPDDYLTIQAAVGNASDGDKIMVRNGTYEGQVLEIDKSLSLIGENPNTTKIILHPLQKRVFNNSDYMAYDHPIQISANQVSISGFTITSDGGSFSVNGADLQLRDNYLDLEVASSGDGAQIIGNNFDGLFPVCLTLHGSYQVIVDNTFTDSGMTCDGSFNTIINNKITIYQTPYGLLSAVDSNSGIGLAGSSNLILNNTVNYGSVNLGNADNNLIEKNNMFGIELFKSSNNEICGNDASVVESYVNSTNVFYGNNIQGIALADQNVGTFYENNFEFAGPRTPSSVMVDLGVLNSLIFDNGSVGNYWSDYSGHYPNAKEIDNSGIGDTPYVMYLLNGASSIHKYVLSDQSKYTITITDRHPLISPFNTSTIQTQLPSWTNTTLPNSTPEPSVSPQNQASTQTPQTSPTPNLSSSSAIDAFISSAAIPIIAAFAVLVVVIVCLIIYGVHRKVKPATNKSPAT